jgi:NADH-quinone oxidoreductase subunit C
VTPSPSDESNDAVDAEALEPGPLAAYAASVAEAVGAASHSTDFGTIKVIVEPGSWVAAVTTVRDDFDLNFFSWLSAVDWSNDGVVGDGPAEEVEERFEVLCALGDITDGNLVILSTSVDKDTASIASLVDVFPGAAWHERESHEMFGIDFAGNPDLSPLYLPDSFIGHPLRKDYPLLSREVKPWPGKVDVEDMPGGDDSEDDLSPSTENPEA